MDLINGLESRRLWDKVAKTVDYSKKFIEKLNGRSVASRSCFVLNQNFFVQLYCRFSFVRLFSSVINNTTYIEFCCHIPYFLADRCCLVDIITRGHKMSVQRRLP